MVPQRLEASEQSTALVPGSPSEHPHPPASRDLSLYLPCILPAERQNVPDLSPFWLFLIIPWPLDPTSLR